MPGFAENFIRGMQAGHAQKDRERQIANEAEDRSIKKMILDHEMRKLKIEEALQTRAAQRENYGAQEGRPEASYPTTTGPDPAMAAQGISAPGQVPNLSGGQLSGIPELGVGDTPLPPHTTLEEQVRRQQAAELFKVMHTAVKTGPGDQYGMPGQPPLISTPALPPKPDMTPQPVMLGGKPSMATYAPPEPGQTAGTFTAVPNARPMPPASVQNANAPIPEIKEGSREYTVARDLAYGKLTMAQFRGLYAYSRDVNKKQAIYQKAGEINPNFNPAQFEMGFKLASSPKVQQQLASMDNVIKATPDLIAVSDAAQRSGVTKFNEYTSPIRVALGNRKFSNLRIARIAFADELSGALGYGSATDMSRDMGFNMTDPNLSPANFASGLNEIVVPFIQRKRQTLLDQMGVYGQPGMNSGAQPMGGGGGKIIVTAPDGSTHPFDTQAQADAFKKLAGIK